jgi:excisionase family DNA binding protein
MKADALNTDDRLTVSVSEACRLLGIGRTSVYQLIAEGRIKTTRIGNRRLVRVDSLRELVTAEAA